MSLWLIKKNEPAFNYATCEFANSYVTPPPGGWHWWKDQFCTLDNPYFERFSDVSAAWNMGSMFYDPQLDKIILVLTFDNPISSYYSVRIAFDAGTLALTNFERSGTEWYTNLLSAAVYLLSGTVTVGSYNCLYRISHGSLFTTIALIEYNPSGEATGWELDYTKLPNCPYWAFFSTASCAIVNREDGILVIGGWQGGLGGKEIHFWKDFETANPIHLGCIYLPSSRIYNFTWENRKNFWVVWEGGRLAKINMHNMEVEVYSQVQTPNPSDKAVLIAWDSKRGRMAAFRLRQDAEDHSAVNALEVYRPIPKPVILTQPVPVAPLRVNKTIPFTFHLLGDGGEGVSPYLVTASLAAPAAGSLGFSTIPTRDYGWGLVPYKAPNADGTDTLQLQTNVVEGEQS